MDGPLIFGFDPSKEDLRALLRSDEDGSRLSELMQGLAGRRREVEGLTGSDTKSHALQALTLGMDLLERLARLRH